MAWTKLKSTTAAAAAVILVAGGIILLVKKAGGTAGAPRPGQMLSREAQDRLAAVAPVAQLSPFTKVRYDGDTVMVTFMGTEYQLAAIDELSAADLLDFCCKNYGRSWQKRFAEDLVVVLADMGHPVDSGQTVSLRLVDPRTGEAKNIPDAPMTAENRREVHEALHAEGA